MNEKKKKNVIKKQAFNLKQPASASKENGIRGTASRSAVSDNEKWSSEIENLDGILADKEIYIDNLIGRLGSLERRVVDMDIKAKTFEKDQLEAMDALKQKLEAEVQANQQLLGLIEQLNQSHQLLFGSLTWRVGYFLAQTIRRLKFWHYRKTPQKYMTSEHFRNIINGCAAYTERRQVDGDNVSAILLGQDSNNDPFAHADIEVTMKILWEKIKNESKANCR